MSDGCDYDVAPSTTTSIQPCGAPTVDGVYCGTHAEWMRTIATNPAYVEWWRAESEKAARIAAGDS